MNPAFSLHFKQIYLLLWFQIIIPCVKQRYVQTKLYYL